jgi:hypothetical protein
MEQKSLELQFEEHNLKQATETHAKDMEEREIWIPLNKKVAEQEMYRRNLEVLTSIYRCEKGPSIEVQTEVAKKMLSIIDKLES